MSKHELKHHRLGVITICGIFIGGPAVERVLAEYFEDVTCRRCLNGLEDVKKCFEYVELPTKDGQTERRVSERAARLALKARAEAGLSWQEAKALASGRRPLRRGCIKD